MSVPSPISEKLRTVVAASTVEHDWSVVIDANSYVTQPILSTRSTNAKSLVQSNAIVAIPVYIVALKSASVWWGFSRQSPNAIISSKFPAIRIPPLSHVLNHVQKSCRVAINAHTTADNDAQKNA